MFFVRHMRKFAYVVLVKGRLWKEKIVVLVRNFVGDDLWLAIHSFVKKNLDNFIDSFLDML